MSNSLSIGTRLWGAPHEAAAREYVDYAGNNDKEHCLRCFDKVIEKCEDAFDNREAGRKVSSLITKAVSEKTPFSVIRLGDADGNVIGYYNDRQSQLQTYNIEKISSIYFGDHALMRDNIDFFYNIVTTGILEGDVIGAPERATVEHSFSIALEELDVRGMCGMRDVYLGLSRHENTELTKGKYWVSTWISRQLLPHYTKILFDQPFLGVVSCYPDLAKRLSANANIKDYAAINVPMQASIARNIKLPIRHWPDEYERIVEQLRPPFQGAVYMVAAGILSKDYCTIIKRRGGIAIDVGSIADVWIGNASRPGMTKEFVEKWKLSE